MKVLFQVSGHDHYGFLLFSTTLDKLPRKGDDVLIPFEFNKFKNCETNKSDRYTCSNIVWDYFSETVTVILEA